MSILGALHHLEQYIRERLGHSREASGQRLSRQQSGVAASADYDDAHAAPDAVAESPPTTIQSLLPPEILLNIFAYLNARDLCACACVSRHFHQIGSDELLWQFLLNRDLPSWPRLSHDRNPDAMVGQASSKEVYIRCCPLVKQNSQAAAWYLPGGAGYERVRQYLAKRLKRNPRFALLGSGIESRRTSKLVYSLVHNRLGQQFEPISMINGVDGIGSGITYRMTSEDGASHVFDLLTLYSSRREDRERQVSEAQRVRGSILLQRQQPQGDQSHDLAAPQYQVIPTVGRLELDGIIYTVDAESSPSEVADSWPEFAAFAASLQPTRPVLVLPLVGRADHNRLVNCRQVVQSLRLTGLANPWCVQESDSKELGALAQSLVWMMGHT